MSWKRSIHALLVGAVAMSVAMATPAGAASLPAGTTIRTSVATDGTQGNSMSGRFSRPAISGDGNVTAYDSISTNLVPDDTNGAADVFVHDNTTGVTERVSVSTAGDQANADSTDPSVDRHGQVVAFDSSASNLVTGDTNRTLDVFVRNRSTGQTILVSATPGGTAGNAASFLPSISANGRFVAFVSDASDLIAGGTNGQRHIFVRDLLRGTTQVASIASDGTEANSSSASPSISADGSVVAFASFATNLVSGDTNDAFDVFVRDRRAHTTVLASVAEDGTQGDFPSIFPAISGNGRAVAFASDATNLVPDDTNGVRDVFLRVLASNRILRVSVANDGSQSNNESVGPGVRGGLVWGPAINYNGTKIAFDSIATNLVTGDTNTCEPFFPNTGSCPDIFVRDRSARTTTRVSVASDGTQGDDASTDPAIDASGADVVFFSAATTLVGGDSNFCLEYPVPSHCPDIYEHFGP